jgi:DNA polymerase
MDTIVALDCETEYSKELSVQIQGNGEYARQAKWFLVSLFAPGLGIEYVGAPEAAPWEKINQQVWISHNAGFDSAIFYAGRERGQVPFAVSPRAWHCSADLAAYSLLGRKLNEAVKNAFGVELKKTVRDSAKGKKWPESFSPEQQEDFRRYCLEDARWCFKIWDKYAEDWPDAEREFADIIRLRANNGVAIDLITLEESLTKLQEVRDSAEDRIPWAAGNGVVLSHAKVRAYCDSVGIPAPASLAEDNAACAAWERKYGNQYPVIGALRLWRKANILLRKHEAVQRRLKPDGRMCFGLKYHGAGATGRLSGTDGWNIQNLNRDAFHGVSLRKLLVASQGKKFVISDYSQIEPRVTAWVGGNAALLAELVKGTNLYEADAVLAGWWTGEPGTFKKSNPKGYQLQKAQTLGIGYGMGAERFQQAARQELDLDLSLDVCSRIIREWHARNPNVRRLWNQYEYGLIFSLNRREDYTIVLPSGRKLHYLRIERSIQNGRVRYTACSSFEDRRSTYWGGKLFENVIQAIARDCLRDAVLRLESAGVPVIFSSHDEVCCEVVEDFRAQEILELMVTPNSWAPDLPLAAEVIESQVYTK